MRQFLALFMLPVGLFSLAATGCTAPNSVAAVTPLDQPAHISAQGAVAPSELAVHRQGALDPAGSDLFLSVHDTDITLETDAKVAKAAIVQLRLQLADVDLPPSATMPDGMKLREQTLTPGETWHGEIVDKTPDTLTIHVRGRLRYDSKMVLENGSLYALGASYTQPSDATLRVTRAASDGALSVTVDAAPADTCASIGSVLTLSRCALFVEAPATATPMSL